MFAYIKGSLEMKFKNYVVIDVGGLGYKIFMPENDINSLGEIGEIINGWLFGYPSDGRLWPHPHRPGFFHPGAEHWSN